MSKEVPPQEPLRRFQRLNEIIGTFPRERASLIPILQAVQTEFRYLPEEMITFIATALGLSPAAVYGVATFYAQFSTEPKGKHIIQVCDGTACHVRDATDVLSMVSGKLKLEGEQTTTADLLFTMEKVACIGACALAPAMMIDGRIHGLLTPEKAAAIIDDIARQEENHAQA
jgi:NADH-quinone oxidoreductase subunit E